MTEMREVLSQQVLQTLSCFDWNYLELAVEMDWNLTLDSVSARGLWKWMEMEIQIKWSQATELNVVTSTSVIVAVGVNKNRRTQEHAGRKSPPSLQNLEVILYPDRSSSSSRVRFLKRLETNWEGRMGVREWCLYRLQDLSMKTINLF